jgi:predicted transcriptional regulator
MIATTETPTRPTLKQRVLDFVASHPGRSTNEIAKALGTSPQNASHYIHQLRRAGKVRVDFVRKGNINRVYVAPEDSGFDEDDE